MKVYRLSGEFNRTFPTREAANDALGILLERQEIHSLDIKEVEIDEVEIETSDGVAFWRRALWNLPSGRDKRKSFNQKIARMLGRNAA